MALCLLASIQGAPALADDKPCSGAPHARGGSAPDGQDAIDKIEYFVDRGGAANIETASQQAYKPTGARTHFGNGIDPIWFRIHVSPSRSTEQRYLSVWPPITFSATLYQPSADGGWESRSLGSRFAFADRPVPLLALLFPVRESCGVATTLYVKVETPTARVSYEIKPLLALLRDEHSLLLIQALALGVGTVMLVISVVAWWLLRLNSWLLFIAFDILTLFSAAVRNGLASMFVVPEAADLVNHAFPFVVGLHAAGGIAVFAFFCRLTAAPRGLLVYCCLLAALPAASLVFAVSGDAAMALRLANLGPVMLLPIVSLLLVLPTRCDPVIGWAVRAAALVGMTLYWSLILPWLGLADASLDVESLFSRLGSQLSVFLTVSVIFAIAFRQTQLALRERHQLRQDARLQEERRVQAEAANAAKTAFLAYMSHEIRTPLNAVVGLAELAEGPDLAARTRGHYLRTLSDSARHLAGVVSNVLDFSKIESGKMQLDDAPFDLDAFVSSLVAAHRVLAERKGLAFRSTTWPASLGWVHHDPARLRQILSNFLSNALKFTTQGEIRLDVQRGAGQRYRFVVTDTGPGLTQDEQARLFTPYVQVGGLAQRAAGSGLGLSICRELAGLMHGQVGVHSTTGAGSSFWLELVLPQASPCAGPLPAGNGLVLDGLRGRRVLVADDVASNQILMEGLLRREGAVPVVVGSGAEAVTEVERHASIGTPIDIAFLDLHMPGVGGLEATRRIRQLGTAGALPIVALTGGVSDEERQSVREAGMDDFLSKPITAVRLRTCALALLDKLTPSELEVGGS